MNWCRDCSNRIYSIAFTEQSDQQLLQDIADATDGRYALAASSDVLHKVFAKIFEQSKQPNMLPLTENAFMVDTSIREVTIIANKKSADSQIYLQPPDGERISSTFKSENMKWFVSSSFDMITLTRPQQGEWKILFSDNENRAYIIADIKLRTRFEYNTQSEQPELTIRTWFEKDDQLVAQSELVSNMALTLEIQHPDGRVEQLDIPPANEEGLFIIQYRPAMDGIYAATVIAMSKTFQRQQVFSFRATIPRPATPLEPAPVIETAPPQAVEPVEAIPEPQPAEDDMGRALMIFLAVNLALVFIGFNVFFILRMKKQTQKK
jgi:subtilisin-like proprotein convertase family protein